MKRIFFSLLLLNLLPLTAGNAAEQISPAEQKLREGLRATMLQLRDSQGQIATLQATQTENELKIQDLTAKLEALTKESTDFRITSEKSIADLNTKLAAEDAANTQLRITLDKWKQGYNQVAELAKATEGKRAKLDQKVILLDRKVADQATKNHAMFKLGNEILERYEKFGLGDALTAREPFVGITRIKFQNLIQDYGDGLVDQKIKP